ncbi:serine-rich adhesin for platelets-like isoform X3 [Mytilus trossulus]|uniref:serine-rich adhesin for platelets-like isoform X3 n=1 Tax=Mytilus trossulus TaxID=6551 RepID=UPI00300492B8
MKKVENRRQEKVFVPAATSDIKDVLERKIEELSRHLAEEKQVSRREKIHVARLHRELARFKGDKEVKEKDNILKDLERERMLRADAEKKLRELTIETDQSHSRLRHIQTEFQNMEQAVSQMMQFKSKIDQLKHEKSSLSMQYENNLQKYNSHISSLERENIMLLNDVKKFEQQMSNGTDQERTKLLLERLKMLEAENSSLVLENEQQRQQYEKCLDEIANQVVQALLAQKALREECVKLQTRVQDLEFQNKELNCLFQQKVKYSSDTVLQSLPPSQTVSTSTLCESTGYYNSVCSLPPSSSVETMHITSTSHSIVQSTALMHHPSTSTDSLPSSDNAFEDCNTLTNTKCNSPNCGTNCDNRKCRTKIETEFPATNSSPKMKHVSVVERASEKAKQRSSSTSSLNTGSKIRTYRSNSTNASLGKSKIVPPGKISQSSSNVSASQIETTVQINQSDSSVKRRSLSQPDHINKTVTNVNQSKTGTKPTRTELSKSSSKLNSKLQKSSSSSSIPTKKTSKSQSSLPQSTGSQSRLPQKKTEQDSGRKNSGQLTHGNSNSRVPKTVPSTKTQGSSVSKLNQTSTQSDINTKLREVTPTNNQPARVPSFPNGQYFYDYSDEDSDINRPISGCSNGSTISINEILDDDDDTDTLLDADFTAEKFAFFETPQFMQAEEKKKEKARKKKEKSIFSSLRGKPDIVKDTEYSEQKNKIKSPRSHRRRSSLPHSNKTKQPNRPSSLVLNSKDKNNMKHGYSSSSLSSSESDENWSPQFARQYQLKLYKARNKSGSSESGSMSGSLSEKTQLKSSQELTPTVSEKSFGSQTDARDKDIYREVIVVKNIDNSNVNSLNRKRGPPPPIPKKPPIAGRRSPGIIMGIQSPGLRNKTLSTHQELSLLRPHEFKTGVFDNVDAIHSVSVIAEQTVNQTHKYMSSDSSFESVKNEKVERSGSKDDGYSTMSSDIQPEMLEKFSDSSLKRDAIFRNDFQVRNDMTVMHVTDSSHKFVNCGTSPLDTSAVNSNSPKRSSPNMQDKSGGYNSLGRVKAMKQMFEAECQKQNDTCKRFPLRKSFSVDSKLGHNEKTLNRRSLGDDVQLNVTEIDETESRNRSSSWENKSDHVTNSLHHNDTADVLDKDNKYSQKKQQIEERTNAKEQDHYVSKLDHVTLTSDHVTSSSRSHMTSDRNSIYHMLNDSEENFLSDIPEEKEDYGEMSGASNEKLLDFPVRKTISKKDQISNLQLFETSTTKHYWSSTLGLCRFLSDSDLEKISKRQSVDDFKDIGNISSGKALERSVSLSGLNTKTEILANMKLAPTLRRSCRQSLINEINVNDRVQDIVKEHILKQLANSVDSESDDDLQNYSFDQLLAKKQRQNYLAQSFESKFNQPAPFKNQCDFPEDSFSSNYHENEATFSSNEEREEKGRQSSKESSPMGEKPSKFRSDYYSLCMVGSNRSLFSGSNEGESDQILIDEPQCVNCKDPSNCRQCTKAKNTEEFDEISRQLQSLSKTVNALQQSLTGVDSCDSDAESNEDHSHMFISPNSDFHGDGYQWVEDDEFYLTPCGGELIMGASPFSDTGACAEWINEYADDTSCNDEFEFYGNFADEKIDVRQFQAPIKEEEEIHKYEESRTVTPPESKSPIQRGKNGPQPCDSYSKQKALKKLRGEGHVRHHSDGHLSKINHESKANGTEERIGSIYRSRETTEDNKMSDPQVRAAMLDAMVHLSGASMDSLDDNIGVDHVMCSRLLGGDKGPVRSTGTRSAVDLSQFFVRYGEPEEEAVAAFDFLDEIPADPLQQQMTGLTISQSNTVSQCPQTELTNKGPEDNSPPVQEPKQLESENSQTKKEKCEDVKGNTDNKSKLQKPEKKFFNFTRSKSTKSTDNSKERDSKLPKKVKSKEIKEKDKETPKEKSKIPKFRSSSSERKVSKQFSVKTMPENSIKSTGLKHFNSGSQEHVLSLKTNNRIVDKL